MSYTVTMQLILAESRFSYDAAQIWLSIIYLMMTLRHVMMVNLHLMRESSKNFLRGVQLYTRRKLGESRTSHGGVGGQAIPVGVERSNETQPGTSHLAYTFCSCYVRSTWHSCSLAVWISRNVFFLFAVAIKTLNEQCSKWPTWDKAQVILIDPHRAGKVLGFKQ